MQQDSTCPNSAIARSMASVISPKSVCPPRGPGRGIPQRQPDRKAFSLLSFVALLSLMVTLCLSRSAEAQSGCFTANSGAVGVRFDSGPAAVAGGTSPYRYAITGTLPAGLALNSLNGQVAGTPTSAGQFSVQATDSMGLAVAPCSITIGTLKNAATVLGQSNAYNLVALTGDISSTADITGRIAAAGQITMATTVGTALRTSDPFLATASANGGPFAMVAGGGIPTADSFNVNAGGNVYSSTPTNATFNFANEEYVGSKYAGSKLITGGTSPINFSSLQSSMKDLSSHLSGFNAYGVVCSVDNFGSIIAANGCPANPVYFSNSSQHYNPSWLVLYGTDASLNVFNVTADQLQNPNLNLDIEVPTGSTVIVNVSGSSATIQNGIYFQGSQVGDNNAGTILFNFPTANWVTVNGQFDGFILAPNASVSGTSQMGGLFVGASLGATGEVHYVPFTGVLPSSESSSALSIACASQSTGMVGVVFKSGAMSVSGGTAPYTYSIVGSLPSGLALNASTGEVSGTASVSGSFQVRVTDAAGASETACAITINPAISVSCPSVTIGDVGLAFDSGSLNVTGGVGPYKFSVVGTLPAGLSLNTSTGQINGTATAAGTFAVKVTDANANSATTCNISISGQLSVGCAAKVSGTVGVAFSSGAMVVTGGSTPYTYSIVGTLPAGLTLNSSTGEVTGTATAAGTFAVKVTDALGSSSTACNLNIGGPLTISCAALNTGTVGTMFNSGSITVTGGTGPYTYSVVGALPAGLTLDVSTGIVAGTPLAAGVFSIKVTDANGASATSCNLTILGPLSVSCAANNTGVVGSLFNSGVITVTGGASPYTYSVVGVLPAGLSLNASTGLVAGTATASGAFAVRVTDSVGNSSTSCNLSISGPISIGCAPLTLGTVGVAFNSGALTVSGGVGKYTYSIVGTLPAGLTLNASTGAITGTATAAGTFAVKVTDSAGNSATSCNLTINLALSAVCASVSVGEVGLAFNSGPVAVTGGTGPYTYSVVGTLPAGLTLNASTGAVTGVSTGAGTFSVKVTDSVGASTSACPINIGAQLAVACPSLTSGLLGVAFNSGSLAVTGGVAPYSYSVVGTLPAGLSLNASTGAVSGIALNLGSFGIKVTDALGGSNTPCGISINALLPISVSCPTTTTGTVGVSFNSGALTVSGGLPLYTYSVVGTLPAGLTLNALTGAVTGIPSASGTFSIKVTDLLGTSNTSCSITINAAGGPIVENDTAIVDFWNGKDGQALILALNGSSTATNLGNWLATNFPYLYGSNSSNNLTGKTNADIAALYQTLFKGVAPKTSAQMLSTALSVYATNSTLAGSTAAINCGFNFSATGTGIKTFNIGSDGLGAALLNNTSYSVMSLLQQANRMTQLGLFNSSTFASIFSKINLAGGLSGSANTVAAAYTLTVNPANVTVVAGQSATATFTFSPVGGYVGTVNFTCSGLPVGATCSFTPASVTANGSNTVQTSTLKITTSTTGTATIAQASRTTGATLAGFLLLPGVLLAGSVGSRRRAIATRLRGLALMLLIGIALGTSVVGCGSGVNFSGLVGPHTVSVVATTKAAASGGASTQTADFTLTVTQ